MYKEKGYSQESLHQVIEGLESIASKVNTFEQFFERLSYLQEIIQKSTFNMYNNAVTLSTIHSSKGLEFDNVFIIDLVEGQFPSSVSIKEFEEGNTSLFEEEVRLFYVGITRAKNSLEIITYDKSNKRKISVSRFVKQLYNANNNFQKERIFSLNLYSNVTHPKFGVGTIISINQDKDVIKVTFQKFGTKSLSIKAVISGNLLKFKE
jgi:DNA helicase-2/ATP-dependent DNA helicase PcrA